MTEESARHREGRGRHGHHGRGGEEGHKKAKMFRRKRALTFLELLYVKQQTLKGQLQSDDFQASRLVIEGELKATEMILEEFKVMFNVNLSELDEESTEDSK